jgi:hypothetical protein
MLEAKADLWTYPCDYRGIPTNLVTKKNGHLVMGAGVAKQAAERYPELPETWGEFTRALGGGVFVDDEFNLFAFPTKHHWREPSSLSLIEKSARELEWFALDPERSAKTFAMPRPGCGLGGLKWEEVRPLLVRLPDNVVILEAP